MIRIYKGLDKWWVNDTDANTNFAYESVDDMPEPLARKLSLLLFSPDDASIKHVGKKITDSVYWIFP